MTQESVERRPAVAHTGQQRPWLILLWSVPAVFFAAAAYEATLLLDLWGSYDGSARDGFVDAEDWVAAVAYPTMLVGSVVAFVHAFYPRAPWAVALFAPAAWVFVTTRYYTYDPYYLPSLRRYSDDGGAGVDPGVLAMLAAALVVGVLTRLLPRAGSIATAGILLLLLITYSLASSGH